MITDALQRIANQRESLTREEARAVMTEVFSGSATDAQIAALLVALHMKGETVEEIVGFAEAIRAAAEPLPLHRESTLSVSSTGRERWWTPAAPAETPAAPSIFPPPPRSSSPEPACAWPSTAIAGLSSKCGSADVMEALGVKISLPTAVLATCLEEVGIVFLFAPAMHSAMKYVQPARRELRLRTIFNLLGPLTNPARASAQVVGVYSLDLVEKVAEALSMLGVHRALVVHGLDGLDEITITGPTRIAEVREGNVRTYEVTPEEFGIKRACSEDISGGDAAANAAIIRDILAGKKSPRRDVVLLNAAAALVAAGRAEHLADGVAAGSSVHRFRRGDCQAGLHWCGLQPLTLSHCHPEEAFALLTRKEMRPGRPIYSSGVGGRQYIGPSLVAVSQAKR